MTEHQSRKAHPAARHLPHLLGAIAVGLILAALLWGLDHSKEFSLSYDAAAAQADAPKAPVPMTAAERDAYTLKLYALAHEMPPPAASSTDATSTATTTPMKKTLWPVLSAPYPYQGALLPANRIVAYYGNFYSTGMGVLGQYPEDQVISMLNDAVAEWQAADPSTPVIPAIDYIAVTAQGSAGADGMYRARMPDSQIDHALEMAAKVHGIVLLDIQVGDSTLPQELPLLQKYLAMPQVELAIDPEFAMQKGVRPGSVIGTFDAADINYAAQYLESLVEKDDLPPKILVVHRFTEEMVTNYQAIEPLPGVQVVMDMDGWGFPAKKINTYESVIEPEPVQFTGFKLFYKNDTLPPSTGLLTPAQVLALTPAPSFIQYQ